MNSDEKQSKELTESKAVPKHYKPIVIKGEWVEAIQETARAFQTLGKKVRQIAEQINKALSTVITPELIEALKDLPERYRLTLEEVVAACDKLADAGWILPLEFFPFEILEVVDKYTLEELDEYFYDFYTENDNERIKLIFKDIKESKSIDQWNGLIEECIKAYQNGYCLILIPSLLSVVEGLLSKLSDNPQNIKMKSLCKSQAENEDGITRVIWMSIWKFIEQLYKKINFDEVRPYVINRHRILHGRDETNWKPVDVVRLFIAIHTVLCVLPDDD
ncbi:hypothetical protein Ga0466249_001557 [Sporomusaceae bacterium BoRhaA]|uniref:hypothetical protein n=1 Tax=Pelorhabdus rhamnosifermentans TaxID=2772457 RepID=UPI001C060E8F|nr:hypothetical protein [Pelorhabdus rhamnosifermentans]MBU2700465.1 hypothetical protein [Pelorhabdus rhamnosifermentans]